MPSIYHLLISVALGILGVLGIILLCATTQDLEHPPPYKYGIVIDAGSSRTTLFIYKWPAGKENDTGIVSEHNNCHVNGPGISSYAADLPAAGKSLKPCLDKTMKDIPSERHAETPLYLGATAGMRLLKLSYDRVDEIPTSCGLLARVGEADNVWGTFSSPVLILGSLTDPEATNGVLAAIATTMKSYKFNYQGAKILSGNEEGVFGWVTANYLLENFIKYGVVGRWIKPVKSTVGAMDLGGASTQISFVPRGEIENPENEVSLRLYGNNYSVYTHSYLCYGRDQVMKKVFSKMMIAQGYNSTIINPCMPKGYNTLYTQSFIYDSPCTISERPADYSAQNNITFIGSSKPAECLEIVSTIFNFDFCSHNSCAFNNIYQPETTGNFLAFAAFYYTMNFLQNTLNESIASQSELKNAADTICAMDFKQLKEKAPSERESRLVDYCTSSYYIYTLTTRGYKFNQQTFKNIAFQKKVADTNIGWALGYMLNLTNMIPAEDPASWKVQMLGPWAVLIVICILVVVAGVLVLVLSSHSVKNNSVL